MAPIVHRQSTSFAGPLAVAYAALVLYASLFPFTGWRWPPGHDPASLLVLPWPPWRDTFDLWANLLGYAPWGGLLVLALLGAGRGWLAAWLFVLAGSATLSYLTEVTQTFLPNRHPSAKDVAMNVSGAAAGALVGSALHALGLPRRWHGWRRRWFVPRSGGTLALLALWPVALMFPTPLPLGLGQVGEQWRRAAEVALRDVPWATALHERLTVVAAPPAPLTAASEGLAIALGLLAPCMVAFSLPQAAWSRLALTVGALLLGFGGMTLSTLLNFGPQHALSWLTPPTLPALLAASMTAAALAAVPRRVATGIGLLALSAGVALVAQAPTDPYFAQSLKAWEQGRFVHFHGIVRWVGLMWPYAAIGLLLAQLGRRDP